MCVLGLMPSSYQQVSKFLYMSKSLDFSIFSYGNYGSKQVLQKSKCCRKSSLA